MHQVVDVDAAGMRDELRARGIRELPYVDVDGGESWTGLRVDKIVELRRQVLDAAKSRQGSRAAFSAAAG